MTTSKTALRCPHCKGPMQTRSSRSLSVTYRQAYMACIDPACGATYGAGFEITHQISPSAKPDATVLIRSTPPRKAQAPAADVLPTSADATNLTLPGDPGASGPEVPPPPANDDGADKFGVVGDGSGAVWIGYDPGAAHDLAAALDDLAGGPIAARS